ncbi:MAG: class I SAM-dependent RNA methyltransferase [Oscillospiraceae bacterium]|nr:class I SAM-dependent RNA methyltransferase [Oscillospiraceae bacterium]
MNKLQMTAPCHFGLEKTLAFEIKQAGGENLETTDGRINFSGTTDVLVRANISCRTAERIGVVLARFRAETFDDVFDTVKRLPVGEYLPRDAAFPVTKGQSVNSKLTSIPALQRTVKKALAEAMSAAYKNATLPESGAVYSVRFFLHKDEFTLFLDSSGEGLHKRGYRRNAGIAPIKETLAAGIIDIARVKVDNCVIDPFCGSGTILIESAMKALRIPPGLNRRFSAEKWAFVPKSAWHEQRELLKANILPESDFAAIGYDIDPECVKLTLTNARKAGVDKYVRAETRAIAAFEYPERDTRTVVITNPPYAERMLEKADTQRIYREMGQRFGRGHELFIITSDAGFEAQFGREAKKNRKLYNGMLMCRLYTF